MGVRVEENEFLRCFEGYSETPVKLALRPRLFVAVAVNEGLFGDIVHVPRSDAATEVQLVEGVQGERQLLQVLDLNLYAFLGRDVAHLQVEDVLALGVEFPVCCLFALTDGLLVLLFRLLFFLHHAFDARVAERGNESVNAG